MKVSVFIAVNLDGFISRPNGNINWLHDPKYQIENEDFGYKKFFDSSYILIMV